MLYLCVIDIKKYLKYTGFIDNLRDHTLVELRDRSPTLSLSIDGDGEYVFSARMGEQEELEGTIFASELIPLATTTYITRKPRNTPK